MGLFDFLKKDKNSERKFQKSMSGSSGKLAGGLAAVFLGRKTIDEDLLEEVEELLITTDLGPAAAGEIIESVRKEASRGVLKSPEKLAEALKEKIRKILSSPGPFEEPHASPYVILVSGVNGGGKTTSIAKLAHMYKKAGKNVMLAAGDTFRAAAADQLALWAGKLDIPVVRLPDGSDPAAVIHDAANLAKANGVDILIADTAGRLHTKDNLMRELIKINKVASKEISGAPHENLLVIDATGGQNSVAQAENFKSAVGITGVVLTKLDGTAKGGVAVRIVKELGLPIRYIGFGESLEDLRPFDAEDFAEALFDSSHSKKSRSL